MSSNSTSTSVSSIDPQTLQKIEAYIENYSKQLRGPIDHPRFNNALIEIYRQAGLEPPEIIYVDSPLAAAERALLLNTLGLLELQDWQSIEASLGLTEADTDAYVTAVAHHGSQATMDGSLASIDEAVKALVADRLADEVEGIRSSIGNDFLYTYWLQGSLAFAEACLHYGVQVDESAVGLLRDFGQMVSCAIVYDTVAIISENPIEIHWDGDRDVLSNESGPAILYPDGFSVWMIDGVMVDEQIVMAPQTQTVEQLSTEQDQEVKRIRISRFGWTRYLEETEAKVLDVQTIELPSGSTWMESLMETNDGMRVLCTYDPSTGRPYALEVDPTDCVTCEDAQRYLMSANVALEGCSFRPSSVYPVLRT